MYNLNAYGIIRLQIYVDVIVFIFVNKTMPKKLNLSLWNKKNDKFMEFTPVLSQH